MKKYSPPKKWLHTYALYLALLIPIVLQGCDGVNNVDDAGDIRVNEREAAPISDTHTKLRHPDQLKNATRLTRNIAGKSETLTTDLFLAFNPYEADGITPRVLSKYEIANRILEEYGITRRVLNKYGITHRILNQYGITNRVLKRYGITKRMLDKYGVTPRVLSRYSDQITAELLAEFGITEAILTQEDLTQEDLDDFNTLAALLNTYDVTFEEFVGEVEAAEPALRVKVYIDGAHLGVTVAVESLIMDAFLEEIATDPDILFAEPDVAIEVPALGVNSGEWYDKEIIPWGISNINTPIPSFFEMFRADYNKDNPVHVYVLDSGAMPFSWLGDISYVEKKDFTMLFENPEQLTWEEDDAQLVTGFDPDTLGNPYDESGHGTHIAGTIGALNDLTGVVGVAPGVRIHSLKVLTREGRTDISTLVAAVDYVTRAKRENPTRPIVVNLSLGLDIGTTSYNILDEAIEASINEGVIYVAAAGNDGMNADTYSPAHVKEVITVGSFNASNQFSLFSNYGSTVDILAPGEDIVSLSHIVSEVQSFQTVLTSGTSHAAPHVTGAVARYLGSNPHATAAEVKNALKQSAEPVVVGVPPATTAKALDVGSLLGNEDGDNNDNDNDDGNRYSRWW